MEKRDISDLIMPYAKNRSWLALSQDRKEVVGEGKTIREALLMAKKKGTVKPTVIKAIPDYAGFILS